MLRLKSKLGAAVVLVVGILGAGLAADRAQPNPEPKPPAAHPKKAKPDQTEAKQERTDRHGDPLPEGAILRLDSAHLRHGSAIRASALSPDGKRLATAGDHSVI